VQNIEKENLSKEERATGPGRGSSSLFDNFDGGKAGREPRKQSASSMEGDGPANTSFFKGREGEKFVSQIRRT